MSNAARLQASFNSARGVKSFAVQYISIILIILTFIVGAFSGSISKNKVSAETIERGPILVGNFTLAKLFTEGESRLEEVDLAALQQLLLSHDLKAELLVGAGDGGSSIELALARSVTLYRYLLAAGVPAESIQIWAQTEQFGKGAQVTVSREGT